MNKPKKPLRVNLLKPSMREKKRYLAYEITSEKPLGLDADKNLVSAINQTLGLFGAAKAGVMRVKYDSAAQRGVLKVERSHVDQVRASFVMIKSLAGSAAGVRTLKVSGMASKAAQEMRKGDATKAGQEKSGGK